MRKKTPPFDRFRPIRPLGSGGMGDVWLGEARYPNGHRHPCAIKFIRADRAHDERYVERFETEALLGLEVTAKHPNLVTTRAFDVWPDGRLYLVTDLVEGPPLEFVRDQLRDAYPVVLYIADQVLGVLELLHGEGVLHRDLSPGNLLLDRDGLVYVIDLGLAKKSRSPSPGITLGCLPYASPEVIRGLPARPASDLYSLGAVLYDVVTGHPPHGLDIAAICQAARRGDMPTWDPALPRDVRQLLAGLLAVEPTRRLRIEDAREFLRDRFDPAPCAEHVRTVAESWLVTRTGAAGPETIRVHERTTEERIAFSWQRDAVPSAGSRSPISHATDIPAASPASVAVDPAAHDFHRQLRAVRRYALAAFAFASLGLVLGPWVGAALVDRSPPAAMVMNYPSKPAPTIAAPAIESVADIESATMEPRMPPVAPTHSYDGLSSTPTTGRPGPPSAVARRAEQATPSAHQVNVRSTHETHQQSIPRTREGVQDSSPIDLIVGTVLSDSGGPREMTLTVVNNSNIALVPRRHIRIHNDTWMKVRFLDSGLSKEAEEIRPGEAVKLIASFARNQPLLGDSTFVEISVAGEQLVHVRVFGR